MNFENMKIEELLSKLVQIDSTNPGKYEIDIGKYIIEILKQTGADIKTEEVLDGRKNVMAKLEGTSDKPELVYICHMDTVPPDNGWDYSPYCGKIRDGIVYGRGSCDMKGGLSCMLSAFCKVAKSRKKPERTLKIIFTVDEEGDMLGVEKAISSGWVNAESLVLDGEPTNGFIRVSHKGRMWFHIKANGVTAHASTPHLGADAIAAMVQLVAKVNDKVRNLPEDDELGKTTITFGQINGGCHPYVVPDYCEVYVDSRNVPPTDGNKLVEIVEEAIKYAEEYVPGVKFTYEITCSKPYIKMDEKSLLLNSLKSVCGEVTGKTAETTPFTGYTDTAVISGKLNNINCMSYGPGALELAHKPNEIVPIEDLERCEKVYFELAQKLCF